MFFSQKNKKIKNQQFYYNIYLVIQIYNYIDYRYFKVVMGLILSHNFFYITIPFFTKIIPFYL